VKKQRTELKKRGFPTFIDLRFVKIIVEVVPRTRMREEGECEPDDITPEGLWDFDTDTIYVGKWLSAMRKRQVLLHELVHAALDWSEQGKHETHD